jgi:hypothetical protein
VGAHIVNRTENGVLTGQRLWDSATGQFPCGAIVLGVNDGASHPSEVCTSIHQVMHVGFNGCPIP